MFGRSATTPPDTIETALSGCLKRSPKHLNFGWRVTEDRLQWILQCLDSKPGKNGSGWKNRSFCRTREGLLRCVQEYCGCVDAGALEWIMSLPDFHD